VVLSPTIDNALKKITLRKVIKNLLKKYGARPLKKFGQNFLIDKSVLKKIIEAAELKVNDVVLEIGPGIGALTQELAKKGEKVIAIEKDQKMAEILKEVLKEFKNIQIIKADILKIDPKIYLKTKNYKIVANLPFYIVSPLIREFLELIEVRPQSMVLVVQKEVAQRICAKPPDMSLLAISVQFYAKPKIISYISKKSFWPQPKVDSAIIKIVPPQFRVQVSPQFRERFFRIVKAGFSQPRKQLINNLSKKLNIDRELVKNWLLKNNIQPTQRAETLNIKDWIKLVKSYKPD